MGLDEEIEWWTNVMHTHHNEIGFVAFGMATGLKMAKADYGAISMKGFKPDQREASMQPTVIDDDKGIITVNVNGHQVRDWIYANDDQRRRMMSEARWYVEGWCDGREAI